jgi:hypothetical protein
MHFGWAVLNRYSLIDCTTDRVFPPAHDIARSYNMDTYLNKRNRPKGKFKKIKLRSWQEDTGSQRYMGQNVHQGGKVRETGKKDQCCDSCYMTTVDFLFYHKQRCVKDDQFEGPMKGSRFRRDGTMGFTPFRASDRDGQTNRCMSRWSETLSALCTH